MRQEQQLQLVSYEQAQRLKEAGFDWYTDDFYIKGKVYHRPAYINKIGKSLADGSPKFTDWNNWKATEGIRYSAPTVALALKWFRDVKGIVNCIKRQEFERDIQDIGQFKDLYITDYYYDDYELAESALLDELLTLIENQ